ncbi:MAG: hypothetical protein ACREOJ_14540 [Gemmatimonadaceae bacterium]
MPNELNGPTEPTDPTERVQLSTPEDKERRIGQARDRAMELKATVADKLEAGAGKLRDRVSSAEMAGVTPKTRAKLEQASQKVAAGMENTADWVRTTDAEKARAGIEHQVKTRPGRSLLVALGLGVLIGSIFRRK